VVLLPLPAGPLLLPLLLLVPPLLLLLLLLLPGSAAAEGAAPWLRCKAAAATCAAGCVRTASELLERGVSRALSPTGRSPR
jgi:hypothetical protein